MEKNELIEKITSLPKQTRILQDSELGLAIRKHGDWDHDCSNWSCFSDIHLGRVYSAQPVCIGEDIVVWDVHDQWQDQVEEYFEI